MMRLGQAPNANLRGASVQVDQRLWPLFNDLLIIAGNDSTCTGSLAQTAVDDLTFVVRSLCRRVANQQLKEKCISMIGGTNDTYIAPLSVNCGPENFNKPGDNYSSPVLTLQEFNWRLVVEARSQNDCMSYVEVEPVAPNTVWSVTARFQIMINNMNFESGDIEFSFNGNRQAVTWRNSPQPGLIPRAQMRGPLKVVITKVGVRALPLPDFQTVTPDDANTSVFVEGKSVPVNFQQLGYHCPALRGVAVIDGKTQLPSSIQHSHFRIFLENLFNNAPVNAAIVAPLLDVSSSLQCVLVRERCEVFLIQTTELPFPVKLDLATRYKLSVAQGYCLSVIRNHKEVEEARADPEFDKMCELAKLAFQMKEKSLSGNATKPVMPVLATGAAIAVKQEPGLPSMQPLQQAGPGPMMGGGPMGPGPMGPGGPMMGGGGGPGPMMGPGPMGPGPMMGGPGPMMGMMGGPGPMRGGPMGPGGPMMRPGPMGPRPGGPRGNQPGNKGKTVGTPQKGNNQNKTPTGQQQGNRQNKQPLKKGSGGRAVKI
ncbi:unnamed protein product, partial [Mesorhabditis spiculigera]